MSYIQAKWEANREKVAFAEGFPGRQTAWEAAVGKTVEAVVPVSGGEESVALVFTDGDFLIAPKLRDTPKEVLLALEAAKPVLVRFHAEAYERLEELIARDRELTHRARMLRIVDAVRNNLDAMPGLEAALLEVLEGADET